MQIGVQVWVDNFKKTLVMVCEWAQAHRDKVKQVFFEPRSDKVIFFFVPNSEQFDFDLGFALADLDVNLNTQWNIGYAETRQIPDWDRATFISAEAHVLWPAKDK